MRAPGLLNVADGAWGCALDPGTRLWSAHWLWSARDFTLSRGAAHRCDVARKPRPLGVRARPRPQSFGVRRHGGVLAWVRDGSETQDGPTTSRSSSIPKVRRYCDDQS